MNPDLLVRLANLTVARRPGRGPRVVPDPLASAAAASDSLGVPVVPADLDGLRELHEVVVELVDRLLGGRPVTAQAARLSAIARPSRAVARLQPTRGGGVRSRLEWAEPTLVAGLARQVVLELGALEEARLRRCARAECRLVFYDTTRSNTRRWHAESPCGQRERQRRHRSGRGVEREIGE